MTRRSKKRQFTKQMISAQTGDSFVKDCKLQKADLQRLFAYPANKREN